MRVDENKRTGLIKNQEIKKHHIMICGPLSLFFLLSPLFFPTFPQLKVTHEKNERSKWIQHSDLLEFSMTFSSQNLFLDKEMRGIEEGVNQGLKRNEKEIRRRGEKK